MKVLLTAFKPFNNSINNYSEEVLKYINSNVTKEILDVVYDECFDIINSKYELNKYDLIIAMGEARMRNELTLEVQAKNIASCSLQDNKGILKKDCQIIENGKEIIQTKVDIDKVKDMIKLSFDAGKFVCNNIYYHLLYNYPQKSLFIHIPHCNDDVNNYIKYAKTIDQVILSLTKKCI